MRESPYIGKWDANKGPPRREEGERVEVHLEIVIEPVLATTTYDHRVEDLKW